MSITYDEAPASRREIMREIAAIETARQVTRPIVGELNIACDSAADVWIGAVAALGGDTRDLRRHGNAAAAEAAFSILRSHGTGRPRVAMDAKATAARAERFPHGNRLRHG